MEFTSQLRRHLGESAHLVTLRTRTDQRTHLLDFTKDRPGEEITVIEVGEHGVTVEYAASGHKHIFAFDEIAVKERTPQKARPS